MTTQDARDLSLLGLSGGASLPEVRTAYRNLVRQLHPDLRGQDRVADARLAAVNAAYGRLAAAYRNGRNRRWTPETVFTETRSRRRHPANDPAARTERPRPEAPRPEAPRPPRSLHFDAALRAELATFVQRKRGQEAFYRLKEARGGIYPDPRRCGEAEGVDLPGLAHAVEVTLQDGALHLRVFGTCKAGRNLLILPEIRVARNGGLELGSRLRSFEFRCPRQGATVRLRPGQLSVAGAEDMRVELHYAGAACEAA